MKDKQRAIDKLQLEITKEINLAISIAKLCGIGELRFCLHYFHCIRLLPIYGNVPDNQKNITALYVRQVSEAYRYIIQLLYKHSQKKYIKAKNGLTINSIYLQNLLQVILSINSKNEMFSFFHLCPDLEITGERDQFVKINLETVKKDDTLSKYLYYFARSDSVNALRNDDVKKKDDFLNYFRSEYAPFSDLFETEFSISLEYFIQLIDEIFIIIDTQLKLNSNYFERFEDGNIDVQNYKTIMALSKSFYISKKELYDKHGEKIKKILDRLTFKLNEFDEKQLQYNLIARQPLLDFDETFLVSPELLLESLFINSHYSLLESTSIKEEYKKRYSETFLDKIKEIALKYGYTETERELELYEGRNQIGDIDIIFKDSNNNNLLIEAKNHTIPMDVYFHNMEATEDRLDYLKKEWEKKVEKRYKHLQSHCSEYNISKSFKYIIVSKSPEILSHFSNYLVLTLDEFDFWLSKNNDKLTFQNILETHYKMNELPFTKEQLDEMLSTLQTGLEFREE